MLNSVMVAAVAIGQAVPNLYHYLVPAEAVQSTKIGLPVLVPLRNQTVVGYIMGLEYHQIPKTQKLKTIKKYLSLEPLFGESWAKLIKFTAQYYNYPPGLCLAEALPVGLKPRAKSKILLTPTGLENIAGIDMLEGLPPNFSAELLASQPTGLSIGSSLKTPTAAKALKKMAATGWLTFLEPKFKASMGEKMAYWVSLTDQALHAIKRLGPNEKILMGQLGAEPICLDALKDLLKSPLTVARRLEQKGLVKMESKPVSRDDFNRCLTFNSPLNELKLSDGQKSALANIGQALNSSVNKTFLLFGVTGSGKSEVYLRAAKEALSLGKQVLWLVPEIALSAGTEGFLRNGLGAENLAVLHSGLSHGERHDQWLKITSSSSLVVLGARSAVFAPLENLGLVIVDEEHDLAYKQDDSLRYQGRDLALWRAKEAGAVAVLGSATPSLESFQASLSGRYQLLRMDNRVGLAGMPQVVLLNSKTNGRMGPPLSRELKKSLAETFSRGEQALLFVNRRGLSNLPLCLNCGEALKCEHCSVNLTLHGPEDRGQDLSLHKLICHRCGYQALPPSTCPACGSALVRYMGLGTEKLLNLALEQFPDIKAERLDADSTRTKGSLKRILEAFSKEELNLLVGTQMAAKGHDFPKLTLVGVIEADLSLNMPDFRAAERTFQLLAQVAGRAGRAENEGLVLIQTVNPEHYTLQAAQKHDYESFYQREIAIRSELCYPPFSRLALIRFSGPDEELVEAEVNKAGDEAYDLTSQFSGEIEILGPMPSPIAKIKNQFRFQILLKTQKVAARHEFLKAWLKKIRPALSKDVKLTVDIDPYNLL